MTETPVSSQDAAVLSGHIVAIAERRDKEAFKILFAHFAPRVKAYLLKNGAPSTSAEDLAQETMVAVWRKAALYDPSRATAATWIFTIARNQRIDAFRREKRPEIDPNDPALRIDPEPQADDALGQAQAAAGLTGLLAGLPEDDRTLLDLAYYQDKSQSMIASELGIPLGTVKSRMRRIFAKLRGELSTVWEGGQ